MRNHSPIRLDLPYSADLCDIIHFVTATPSNTSYDADSGKTLGTTMRDRRRSLNLTQQDLSDLSGVGLRLIHELEHSKSTVKLSSLLAVLNALGLHLELAPGAQTSVIVPGPITPTQVSVRRGR